MKEEKKTICGHCAGTGFIETDRGTSAECAECDLGYIETPNSQDNGAKEESWEKRLREVYSFSETFSDETGYERDFQELRNLVDTLIQEAIAGERLKVLEEIERWGRSRLRDYEKSELCGKIEQMRALTPESK